MRCHVRLPDGMLHPVASSGFQISLNYLMKFNAKYIPNSSRDPFSVLRGSCWVRPALRQDLSMFSLCLLLPSQCKAGCAPSLWEVRPALRQNLCMFPCVCYSPACAKRVALFFAAGCDLPCARRVALFCSERKLLSATCLAQGGSHFFSGWPEYLPFWSSWAEI